MSRDPFLFVEDLLSSARKVIGYCQDMDRDEFVNDEKTFDAVVRNLEIMGEAAKQVP